MQSFSERNQATPRVTPPTAHSLVRRRGRWIRAGYWEHYRASTCGVSKPTGVGGAGTACSGGESGKHLCRARILYDRKRVDPIDSIPGSRRALRRPMAVETSTDALRRRRGSPVVCRATGGAAAPLQGAEYKDVGPVWCFSLKLTGGRRSRGQRSRTAAGGNPPKIKDLRL